MPYKVHDWEYDSEESDPGWPRRYLTYDYHTACSACHEPNGLLRILQHLFGGPATRCRHHHNNSDRLDCDFWNRGWGGDVKGLARRKGCTNFRHYALAFRPGTELPTPPEELGPRKYRTRLPEKCQGRTPRGYRPSYTLRFDCPYPDHSHGLSPPYPVSDAPPSPVNGEEEDGHKCSHTSPHWHQRHSHERGHKHRLITYHGHRRGDPHHPCKPNRKKTKEYHRASDSARKAKGGKDANKSHRHKRNRGHQRDEGRIRDPWSLNVGYKQPFIEDTGGSSSSLRSRTSRAGSGSVGGGSGNDGRDDQV
ncbi:hypothetical protein F5Y19DRAFT_491538 [Xylariaceae sp. FL1651]|nr:hypothetical protein F5Y19DRAFT_491538 [Xylariaceae sp. FL1651]